MDVQGESGQALGPTRFENRAIRGGFLEEKGFELRLRRSRAIGWAEGNESTEFQGSEEDGGFRGREERLSGRAKSPTAGEE